MLMPRPFRTSDPTLPLVAAVSLDRFLRVYDLHGTGKPLFSLYLRQRLNCALFADEEDEVAGYVPMEGGAGGAAVQADDTVEDVTGSIDELEDGSGSDSDSDSEDGGQSGEARQQVQSKPPARRRESRGASAKKKQRRS